MSLSYFTQEHESCVYICSSRMHTTILDWLILFFSSVLIVISFLMYIIPLVSFLFQLVSVGRRKFSANFQLVFRLIKGLIFITSITVLITLIAAVGMTFRDIIVCILAFMPTGWGLLLVSVLA